MAIAYTTLFTALGKIVGGLNEWNTGRGATLTTRVSTLRTQATGIDVDLDGDLSVQQDSAVSSGDGWTGYLGTLASNCLIDAVVNDRPQTSQTFSACLTELVRQMTNDSENLATSVGTVGSVTTVAATGTPTFVITDLDPYTQIASNFTLADLILFTAKGDGTVTVQSQAAASPVTSPSWPSGAGVNTTLTQVDASTTSLGADPGFESWTVGPPPTPVSWTMVAGTAGTTVNQATDTPITGVGTYCLELVGDTTTLRVREPVTLQANTVYYLHAFVKRVAHPADTGTLTVAVRDSSGNVVSGTSSISVATSAASASWTALTAKLATPATLPAGGCYLEIRYTGGIGDTLHLDQVVINAPTLLGNGSIYAAVVKGATATVALDQWTVTITRASPTASLIRGLNRLLSLTSYTSRIPTSGAGTQGNALVS